MLDAEEMAILRNIGERLTIDSDSAEVQTLVKRQQDYITKTYYQCTDEVLVGLGQMYTADERFAQNPPGTRPAGFFHCAGDVDDVQWYYYKRLHIKAKGHRYERNFHHGF